MNRPWKFQPPGAPDALPLAVWLQSPKNAPRFKAIGINLYVALWEGPTDRQLADLKAAGMPVLCDQNAVGLAHRDDRIIAGWMHGDEPDNAQAVTDPKTGEKGWGPCIPPEKIVADYQRLRAADPHRPILLNLGQGVANDSWVGRGAGAKLSDYETYVRGGDIISFDVYPVASGYPIGYVPKGVDRLKRWTGGKGLIWNCIECTHVDGTRKATPAQVRLQVWLSLIHGSRGVIYFVHEFQPRFNEAALLDDPAMRDAVAAINREVQSLAPALHRPALTGIHAVGVDLTAHRHRGATYVFAARIEGDGEVVFSGPDLPRTGRVEVLGETSRRLLLRAGRFVDTIGPEQVRLYRIG